jgi:DNA-binding NtrC family response regulator
VPGFNEIRRVLIVEDDDVLLRALAQRVHAWGAVPILRSTASEGIEGLGHAPDLVIADVCLPDGSALAVFEATLDLSPEPLKVAISGIASAEQAFRLAQLGVRAYLAKPFSLDDLTAAVERILQEAPEFAPLVRASVGRVPMRELQGRVRHLMIDQALARAEGSRSGAARLLDVSRQAVQQVARQRADDSSKEPEDGDAGVKAGQP